MRKLAKALSGKEWVAFVHKASGTYAVGSLGHERGEDIIKWPGLDGQDNAENKAKFIAAANPATVLALLDENYRLTAERDALRENIGGDNTRATADIYFQLVEECEIPPSGSLVEYIYDIKDRLSNAENHSSELDNALCELLPGTQYMDPPDGGSVTPLEQVRRMVADYRNRIAELEARAVNLPKRSVDEVMHMSGFSRDYAEGWCSANDNAIHEIRAAGIGVKGE
ncbi:ead/Ea22-like family protein [Salmonella enterica subsp. salamae serovar 13,22:z:-]|nr:ead/Ea22-like family protein [Salmonella enterica subsp. salamae serovar 13,22:z:-]